MHTTLLALHMLAEPAQRPELGPAPAEHHRAVVHLLRVRGAVQVLVQPRERREFAVAQIALVLRPVPRALRRPAARYVRPRAPTEEARGVRDDVPGVERGDDAVDHGARHARGARTGLEVQHERGAGDERLGAALHRAVDRAALVERRALVVPERIVVLERTLAWGAVHVCVLLPAVVVQRKVGAEELLVSDAERRRPRVQG